MDEQEFKNRSGRALETLYRKLSAVADKYGFEPDFNSGALAIEFEEPKAKFVVSPNTPVRQIWVSAHAKSYKLDWDPASQSFVLPVSSQTLDDLIATVIGQQLDESVVL